MAEWPGRTRRISGNLLAAAGEAAANFLSTGELRENRRDLRRCQERNRTLQKRLTEAQASASRYQEEADNLRDELARTKIQRGKETMLELIEDLKRKRGPGSAKRTEPRSK